VKQFLNRQATKRKSVPLSKSRHATRGSGHGFIGFAEGLGGHLSRVDLGTQKAQALLENCRREIVLEYLTGVLLGGEALGSGLGGKSRPLFVRKINRQCHG
jgi:hypothetical protein